MQFETIGYALADGIAIITLSRPDRMNAFTGQMMSEMIEVFDRIDADDAVRAVIVTGAGKAFCAGADLSGGADGFMASGKSEARHADGSFNYDSEAARDGGGRLTLRIFALQKPIIAAINGAAVGIGSTMTLPMDIRLASESARFGFVFARRGIVPEAASSWFLPRVVGISRALQWCYSGRIFGPQEALEGGLVQSIHPDEQLLDAARKIAREIADNTAAVSVSLTRQMLWRGLGMAHPMEAHRIDSRATLYLSQSANAREGVASFMEKRPADFPMRVSSDMPDFYPWWRDPPFALESPEQSGNDPS
ncbi:MULTISPECIES: crotonase/enoyl-CoA hydratase family protein [Sphingobium]|uniref:crotonase/enoyl-CoA hydratase family protein n=1 Tax=Sphingobium TaxID=165695 RepID=UPI00159CA85B|nr:crotonase/enoyl-CoA hydratase family protein [Sphingobium sp. 15-1]